MKIDIPDPQEAQPSATTFDHADTETFFVSVGAYKPNFLIREKIKRHRRDLQRFIRAACRAFIKSPASCTQLSLGQPIFHYHQASLSGNCFVASSGATGKAVTVVLSHEFTAELSKNSLASHKNNHGK